MMAGMSKEYCCEEMATSGQQNNIVMAVIRGNSIITLEALE